MECKVFGNENALCMPNCDTTDHGAMGKVDENTSAYRQHHHRQKHNSAATTAAHGCQINADVENIFTSLLCSIYLHVFLKLQCVVLFRATVG